MFSNGEVASCLKKIVPYECIDRLKFLENIDKRLLCNKDRLLSILSEIKPTVESDSDYYIYLCLFKIADAAKCMIDTREDGKEEYTEIVKCTEKVRRGYKKEALIKYIDSDISHVLYPNCPSPHSSEDVIMENIELVSDKSMEWIINEYLMNMTDRKGNVDKRVEERIKCKETSVEVFLHRVMKIGVDDDWPAEKYYQVIYDIYAEVCENPLFDDVKKDICEKCMLAIKRIKNLDELQPILFGNLRNVLPLLKKMDVKEVRYVEEILNNREVEIEYVKRHGKEVTFSYNMSERVCAVLEKRDLEELLFGLTHKPDYSSIFKEQEGNIFPFSVRGTNKYFTSCKQTMILQKIWWGSSYYYVICADKKFSKEYLTIRELHVTYLRGKVFDDQFSEEILCMYRLTSELLGSETNFQRTYGACMNILTLTEKMLRAIVKKINPEKVVKSNLQTLFELEEVKKVLKEDQAKCLSYFVSNTNNSGDVFKFGEDYRNRLAHWTDIRMDIVNKVLVSELLYVFESVFNSVWFYWYPRFCCAVPVEL